MSDRIIIAEIFGDGDPYLEDITASTIRLRETRTSKDKRATIHVFDTQEQVEEFCIRFRNKE
jgi:hypothetical protein